MALQSGGFELVGYDEIIGYVQQMQELTGGTRVLTKAAKKGIQIAKADVKRGGWIDQTGYLRKGFKEKLEKSKEKAKKVYDIMPDDSYNDVFVKISKSGKRAYYPASQEYGFTTKDGGYIPGLYFMKSAITSNATLMQNTMLDTFISEMDKLK